MHALLTTLAVAAAEAPEAGGQAHEYTLITTIAVGITAALALGIITRRLGLSPIVGYLLAGIVVGPNTPGFVGDPALAGQLAEIGVILLMFGVGLHFHLKDLMAVRAIAIPGALGQSLAATLVMMLIAELAGWTWSDGLVLGIAISVASTVVLLRVLMDNACLESPAGHVAVGWLIVEDLITVLVLVIMPTFASGKDGGGGGMFATAGIAVLKLAAFVAIVALAGTRFVPWLLLRVARLGSRELFTLAVLVMSVAVATASYFLFGASMALGAFLAGMLVGQSKFSHQAGADILPMRDAFAVLFFVSVGMLFDWRVVRDAPGLMLGVVFVILAVKPLVGFFIVIVLRHSVHTALIVAGGLAQIGEFSFILAQMGVHLGLLPGAGHPVLVAAAIISISLNPPLFRWILKLEPWINRHPTWGKWIVRRSESRGGIINEGFKRPKKEGTLAVVVGYGPVGQTVTQLLREFSVETSIIELSVDTVGELHSQGRSALYGDASRPDILEQAGIKEANYLIITPPDASARMAIITSARELNPQINILTRARYLAENPKLREAGVANICFDEIETAAGLAETVLVHMGIPRERVDKEIPRIRSEWQLITELHREIQDNK